MNEALLQKITGEAIDTFQRDGIVLLKGLFDEGWVEHLREAVAQDMAAPSPMWKDVHRGGTGNFFGDTFVWAHVPGFRKFLRESPVAEVAATVMRATKTNLFFAQILANGITISRFGRSRANKFALCG